MLENINIINAVLNIICKDPQAWSHRTYLGFLSIFQITIGINKTIMDYILSPLCGSLVLPKVIYFYLLLDCLGGGWGGVPIIITSWYVGGEGGCIPNRDMLRIILIEFSSVYYTFIGVWETSMIEKMLSYFFLSPWYRWWQPWYETLI